MQKDLVDITIILDRSGSMETVKSDTIGGFNQFLKEQKGLLQDIKFSLHQFDTIYETLHDDKWIEDIPELTNETFVPRGATALLDAIGRTIESIGKRLDKLSEDKKPEKVIVVIITDGFENSSQKFNLKQINEMISHQQDVYKWQFIFLGANQDAIATASRMGVNTNNAITYDYSSQGIKGSYRAMSANIQNYVVGASAAPSFTKEQREEQEELLNKKTKK